MKTQISCKEELRLNLRKRNIELVFEKGKKYHLTYIDKERDVVGLLGDLDITVNISLTLAKKHFLFL